ncbi:kelch domain-containing protein 8B isoform X2 [Ailuropoda melanoleuca]|uniref:Kelch domain-containing protein 8B n=2 Tax=Ursidae TaxID=9632 RepID=A0A7N5P1X9_AILME|nr:kelch domain-containing protein 8B isoform X2 [Ursus maritimus]XP_011224949.1 kelch domain-containing protein 8B isoform X2 [Ailuropoda melanoleuca]XP_026356612.1 kelch domain-containing protein 8B isoform X2 [Ursus arctos]
MATGGGRAFAWQVFPPMPTCRVYGTVAYQDGHLLVLGGCGRAGLPLDTAETLDMASHTWLALAPLPTARAGAAAVVLGKQVLVVGGVDEGQSPVAAVEAFLADEGRWERRATLPQAAMGVATVERGGRQGKLPVTAFEAFDLEACTWTRHPSLPSRRAFAGCAMAEGNVFSLGGLQQPGPHNFYSRPHFVNTVEMFDLEHGSWTKLPRSLRMRDKRADFVVGSLGGHIMAIGGLGNQPCPLGSVEGFSLARRRWEALPAMPTARCSCSSLQAGPRLFVIGGVAQGPSQAVEALCLRDGV